jgi:hypothetical protein
MLGPYGGGLDDTVSRLRAESFGFYACGVISLCSEDRDTDYHAAYAAL